jgi:hypothetical protein
MQRKSLQGKGLSPPAARGRVRLRLAGRGLRLVRRNRSWTKPLRGKQLVDH